jgi:hypothetical protein
MEVAGPAKSKASADPNRSFGEDNLISSEWESLRELARHSPNRYLTTTLRATGSLIGARFRGSLTSD